MKYVHHFFIVFQLLLGVTLGASAQAPQVIHYQAVIHDGADVLSNTELMYRLDTGAVTGMTNLGIALRQEVCTRWIEEGATIDFVIGHLGSAHFEGELSRNWLGAIAGALRGQMR